MPAALITFIINYTAYLIEIIRSGLESIDKGQDEAAKVLGYSYFKKIWYILLPQAIRRVLPSLGNEAITLVKDYLVYHYQRRFWFIKRLNYGPLCIGYGRTFSKLSFDKCVHSFDPVT